MTASRIPFEDRWYVTSESRPGLVHVVDLHYQPESWMSPRPACGCEESMAKGHTCKHIKFLENNKERLGL